LTASTLGLDQKYEFVFRVIQEIHDANNGSALDFEGFLKELTAKVVDIILFRVLLSVKRAEKLISLFWIYKQRVNLILAILSISMNS
jgi:hypothetical protein